MRISECVRVFLCVLCVCVVCVCVMCTFAFICLNVCMRAECIESERVSE
jgi:hypothetical protein